MRASWARTDNALMDILAIVLGIISFAVFIAMIAGIDRI